ncbi:MAG: hypothetical protein ACP5H3_03815 [Candidatus Aenigmatarchaeota archaeon]|jgi:hypothetical protein
MEGINYARFKTEEELLKEVLYSLVYDVYPKVSAIGGKKINPDIDILEIKRVSQNQFRLTGYEIKLIKIDKRSKGISWNSFYSGIGQALFYLKNGVHRAFLVFGFHESVPNDKLIDEFRNRLLDKKDLLKRIIGNHVSIGVCLYKGGSISPIVEAEYDFYPSDEEIELLSKELLQKKFTFNKSLQRKTNF